jgi:hypothetical protein
MHPGFYVVMGSMYLILFIHPKQKPNYKKKIYNPINIKLLELYKQYLIVCNVVDDYLIKGVLYKYLLKATEKKQLFS